MRDAGVPAEDACSGDCTPIDPPAPRALAPLSTATATSQRPTFHWQLAPGDDGAAVEICADRACHTTVRAFSAKGTSGAPPAPLGKGLYFWRLRGTSGGRVGTAVSPSWELVVGARSAPRDTSWGTFPDVNGDGYADVLVGAFATGADDDGLVYLSTGGPTGLTSAGTVGDGGTTYALYGSSVASAGDVNGDGYGDVVVGARGLCCKRVAGAAYVYLGGPAGLSPIATALDGPPGIDAYFGYSVASAGDVNGDGYADVLVGAFGVQSAYLYLGGPTGITPASAATLPTVGPSNFGIAVAGAGDVNGDGYGDALVGGNDARNGGIGAVALYFGGPGGLSAPQVLSGTTRAFGYTASGAGDVNGDGLADVVIGNIFGPSDAGANLYDVSGEALVFFGTPTGVVPAPTALTATAYQRFYMGESVASAGDVNGDGYDDVVVANGGNEVVGTAFLFLGGPSGPPADPAVNLAVGGAIDTKVAYAGDVNGDGLDDVLTGAPYGDTATLYFGALDVTALQAEGVPGSSSGGDYGISIAARPHR
jgi:hypothetical protein